MRSTAPDALFDRQCVYPICATVDLAPVNINVNIHGDTIKYVLISQNKDVAVAPSQKLTASAGGFIFLGSQDTLELNTIVAGTTNDPANARIKTQGSLVNDSGGAINVQGQQITLEAGQAGIGTLATPVTVNILGANGSLTARAKNDIFINAPDGNIPVDAIYTSGGGVYLNASGSIYDAVASDFAKIQAESIELTAGGSIGDSFGNALHIDIVGTDPADGVRAIARSSINIDAPDGNLDVLDVLSTSSDVTLGAASSIVNVGNLADPKNVNSVLAATDLGANVYGNNIILKAGEATLGGIGGRAVYGGVNTAATAFNVVSSFSAAGGTVSATGRNENLYLDEVTTQLTPNDVTEAIWHITGAALAANGDVALEAITDLGAIAFITAASGNILNGRTDNHAIITSGGANLSANGNIGSATNRTGGWTGRITSTVSNVEAQSASGSIYLWNIGAVTVGNVTGCVAVRAVRARGPDRYSNVQPAGNQPGYSGRWSNPQAGRYRCLCG